MITVMKCARCGAGLDDHAMVCGQCGAVVGMSYASRQEKPGEFAKPLAPRAMPGAGHAVGLARRVKNILRSPRTEWPAIAGEPTTASQIYTGYALPLAAIGAMALFLSHVVLGQSVPMLGVVRENLVDGLAGAILVLAVAFAHVFFMTMIVAALARKLGAACDSLQALKLVAYSYTPIWLAGVAYLFPALAVLWPIAMLYAAYLAFVGLPVLTRCPPQRALQFVVVAGLAAFVLFTALGGIVTALMGFGPGLGG
jgi:hypothetical protein